MHPDKTMQRVINGKRYNVATATLLTSDEIWDGSNWERNGRNTFLYKTRGGAFFRVDLTQWSGERDTIEPLTRQEAMALWEDLPEHNVEYEAAFDAVVEEATAGRPALYNGQAMKQTAIWLPENQAAWLKEQPGGMGETIRALIEKAIEQACVCEGVHAGSSHLNEAGGYCCPHYGNTCGFHPEHDEQ